MDTASPHYLLFSRARGSEGEGHWQFTLRSMDGSEQFEAADVEPGLHGQRLELLTVIRALESLDQPSQVTLMGCSEYIRHGIQYGLADWQSNGWRWEHFGQMTPIKNGDLWQRMERALRFHHIGCRRRRFDGPHEQNIPPSPTLRQSRQFRKTKEAWGIREKLFGWLKYWFNGRCLQGGTRANDRGVGRHWATH